MIIESLLLTDANSAFMENTAKILALMENMASTASLHVNAKTEQAVPKSTVLVLANEAGLVRNAQTDVRAVTMVKIASCNVSAHITGHVTMWMETVPVLGSTKERYAPKVSCCCCRCDWLWLLLLLLLLT